jgi:hypothetical protein
MNMQLSVIAITITTRTTGTMETHKATNEVAVAVAIEDGVNVEVDAAVMREDIIIMVMPIWRHLPGKNKPLFSAISHCTRLTNSLTILAAAVMSKSLCPTILQEQSTNCSNF